MCACVCVCVCVCVWFVGALTVPPGDANGLYQALEEELKAVGKAIRGENDWTLPVLYTVALELKSAAVAADSRDMADHTSAAGAARHTTPLR